MIADARGDIKSAEIQFNRAIGIFVRYQLPLEHAETLYYWGRAVAKTGESAIASEKFDQAIEIYRRMGAGQPWIDRIEAARAKVGSNKADAAGPGQTSPQVLFRKEVDHWIVGYGDRRQKLKPAKGLDYLAQLLRSPHQEIHAFALAGAGSASSDASEILDSQARANYRRQLSELNTELAEAERFDDLGRAERLREQVDKLEAHLASAIGLGGRVRRSTSDAERARVAVTKRIKAAIAQIREVDDSLGHHLAASIVTGNFCCYRPDSSHRIDWKF